MAVQPKSLELLDKARFPADQARAIVGAIEIEIEIDGARDSLATKQDVLALRHDMEGVRKDIDGVRKDVEDVRKELKDVRKDVDGLRKDVEDDVAGLRKDVEGVHKDVEGLRREMGDLRDGLEGRINGVRGELVAEIHISATRSTRQLLAVTLTLMSTLAGIFCFLLTHGVQ